MKSNKPIHFIFAGSGILMIVSLFFLLLIKYNYAIIHWVYIVVIPIAIAGISFSVFYLFIKKFISERLKVVYRSIQKGKTIPSNNQKFKLTKNIFESVEQATDIWVEEKNEEIINLKEKDDFRKEFLGNLAHELKTPLFSIQGYILTLLDGGLEDEKINRLFLERAAISVERLVNLIEDLDEITKLEANTMKMEFENFDLLQLTTEVIESLELKAKDRNIKIKFSKEYATSIVHADRTKIYQVLLNLINNSINYGNNNGTTVIRFHEMNEILLVEISDNGPGIENKDINRLFERFYRVEKSRTRNEGGSGLGLAIVKHIIESHGHSINIRSTVDIGSTFSFTLNRERQKNKSILTSKGIKIR